MTSNLTRDEAAERARLLRVESYQVELDLTGGETTFGSQTTVRFSCAARVQASFIDLTAPDVREVALNGSAAARHGVRRQADHPAEVWPSPTS